MDKLNQNFSVLMSIYIKESPNDFKECLDSLYSQTILPTEIVLVEDGKLTNELYEIIDYFEMKDPKIIKRVPLNKNMGLGKALAIGVKECQYSLVARMDTDDIAVPARFEKQLNEFKKNPELGLLGSDISEFEESVDNIIAKKLVPHTHEEILSYAKRRNPMNHMTVMYKKQEVLDAGNYLSLNGFEDYYLWVRMLKQGTIAKNLAEDLVYARAGKEMFMRRGGYKYLKDSKFARKTIYKVGLNSYFDYFLSMSTQVMVSIVPNKLRAHIYMKLLRK